MIYHDKLFKKFNCTRLDGQTREDAVYFVLDVVNDPSAISAIRAYADSCHAVLPGLANGLRKVASGNPEAIKELTVPLV